MLAALVPSRGFAAPVLATFVGALAAASGFWLTGAGRKAQAVPRVVLPFSAGVLLGVALFGLLPELAGRAGWPVTLVLFALGYGILIVVDRYFYPVCPTCAHDHDHHACAEEFHGFAAPLLTAAAIHSFLDGWSVATAQQVAPLGLRVAVPLAVILHKIPEGIALGGIVCAAIGPRPLALGACVIAEGCTMLGAGIGLMMAPRLGTAWILYPLGMTAGWISYLGFHAVHEEWKRCGATQAFVSALTGVVGAAAIQRGAEVWFR